MLLPYFSDHVSILRCRVCLKHDSSVSDKDCLRKPLWKITELTCTRELKQAFIARLHPVMTVSVFSEKGFDGFLHICVFTLPESWLSQAPYSKREFTGMLQLL